MYGIRDGWRFLSRSPGSAKGRATPKNPGTLWEVRDEDFPLPSMKKLNV